LCVSDVSLSIVLSAPSIEWCDEALLRVVTLVEYRTFHNGYNQVAGPTKVLGLIPKYQLVDFLINANSV